MEKIPVVFAMAFCAVAAVSFSNAFAAEPIDLETKRAALLEELAGHKTVLQLITELRKTYSGREEVEGFRVAAREFRRKQGKVALQEKIQFWNDYGFAAHQALYYGGMKLATSELKKLGETRGVTKYYGRVQRAMEAFERIASFPRPESEIRFPDSLKDFDGPVNGKTVHVARDFGFDPVNATPFFENALTSGASRVVVENVGKPWYIRTIHIPSNIEIVFQKGVRVHMDRTWKNWGKRDSDMFRIWNATNVVMKGETSDPADVVIGQYHDLRDRARHCKTYGGSGICVVNGGNICIKNLRVAENSMDGLVLGGLGLSPKNVYVENVDLDSNFRQACSPCAAYGLYFKKVTFRRTAGAEPLAGVDLEPSEYNQSNSEIYFFDCTFEGNMGGGLLFSTSGYQPITVAAKRCVFKPQRRGALMVFIRQGLYMGRNIKAPGKAVFEECDFQGYSDLSPIKVEGCVLLDLFFRNCTVTDSGELLNRRGTPDASAINFCLNNDVHYSLGNGDNNEQATLHFENFKINGYTNAPPIRFEDHAGHYSVRNFRGVIDFNGKKLNAAKFRYDAPDNALADIPSTLPTNLPVPAAAASEGTREHPFAFRYNGHWWTPPPDYTYLFYGRKGDAAEFLVRQTGWIAPNDKVIRLTAPLGKVLELGEFKTGDNAVKIVFPETGWYAFHPPARHVLVNYKGVNLCYYAGTGKERKIQIDAPNGYVGYFEVPPGGEVPFKVYSGTVELRDAKGALAATVVGGGREGSAYAKLKSASGKAEVWSFAVPEKAVFKFFAPATGVWADSPAAVPVVAKDAVRSPVITLARATTTEDSSAVVQSVPFAEFLKAHPAVAKIVAKEATARLEWAKAGEWSALLKEEKAKIERIRSGAPNEQQQREIEDLTRNLQKLEELSAMEARIPKLSRTELERYTFCNAFIVLYGVYPNKDIGGGFFRCLYDGADMAADHPEVYWWIYKKDFENFIAGRAAEMKLGYRDFTLICDDDRKLDKLLPVLQKFVAASVPEDLK